MFRKRDTVKENNPEKKYLLKLKKKPNANLTTQTSKILPFLHCEIVVRCVDSPLEPNFTDPLKTLQEGDIYSNLKSYVKLLKIIPINNNHWLPKHNSKKRIRKKNKTQGTKVPFQF